MLIYLLILNVIYQLTPIHNLFLYRHTYIDIDYNYFKKPIKSFQIDYKIINR